jgi:hypothetical protein
MYTSTDNELELYLHAFVKNRKKIKKHLLIVTIITRDFVRGWFK